MDSSRVALKTQCLIINIIVYHANNAAQNHKSTVKYDTTEDISNNESKTYNTHIHKRESQKFRQTANLTKLNVLFLAVTTLIVCVFRHWLTVLRCAWVLVCRLLVFWHLSPGLDIWVHVLRPSLENCPCFETLSLCLEHARFYVKAGANAPQNQTSALPQCDMKHCLTNSKHRHIGCLLYTSDAADE